MSVLITAIHLSAGTGHQNINRLRWADPDGTKSDTSSVSALIEWIERGGQAFVGTSAGKVPVRVVDPVSGIRYLRSFQNGKWTDNLLALPRF